LQTASGIDAMNLCSSVLDLDCAAEVARISSRIVAVVAQEQRRRGVVIALSGGVDSSVCGALAVRALGPQKVYGLMLPEKDSKSSSKDLGQRVAEQLGIPFSVEDIAPTLEAIGCYRWRDEAMRRVFPDYADGWKSKIAISGGAEGRINFFKLIVQSPEGQVHEARLPIREYLQIVAATNYKQRIRKTVEYFHADRLNYAVIGTPNRLEYDQGFFVKNGDGAADIKPIAHLYKTQVYALARYLGLPDEVCSAKPTTDTYSLPQGQDEFYFSLPYDKMDIALWAHNHGIPVAELAAYLGVDRARGEFIYADIESKRRATRYLHARPALLGQVDEIDA
jgi:NAD+ synthase